jgi:hypothetical protein
MAPREGEALPQRGGLGLAMGSEVMRNAPLTDQKIPGGTQRGSQGGSVVRCD